jgi:hypothetical protein
MHPCCIFTVYLLFPPPPSLSIAPETADDTAVYDYDVDDPTPSAELPGKQNPLDHPDIAHSFPPMLALVVLLLLLR